jgi:serine/threonine protein phosphatase 1
MGRRFVMGDIHGNYKGLLQCLERSGFNKEEDLLIQLGDVADGWSEVFECVTELLSIKNLISIVGNHDDWTLTWMKNGAHPGLAQGGRATVDSYIRNCDHSESYMNNTYLNIPKAHKDFFYNQRNYYIDEQNNCFVHGGFNRHLGINEQTVKHIYYWDRDLWMAAMSYKGITVGPGETELSFKIKDKFKEVFIGHTATINWGKIIPMKAANIWNLDTGSGFKGVLTIMNIDTKEYWQSDFADRLYPDEKGR